MTKVPSGPSCVPVTMKKLTQKQENFCLAYIRTGSPSDAYRAAYNAGKMKAQSIAVNASKLLADTNVALRVKELQSKAADLAVIDRARYIKEMNRIAHSDVRKFYHVDGRIRLPTELDDEAAACVKSFKIDEYGRVEYQLWDKPGTLVTVARIDGAFEKDNKQAADALGDLLLGLSGKVLGKADGRSDA